MLFYFNQPLATYQRSLFEDQKIYPVFKEIAIIIIYVYLYT